MAASPAGSDDSGPEVEAPVSTERGVAWLETHKEVIGWTLAILVTVGVAIWIYVLQLAYPIPPGADPGNWISISYAYIGGHYYGQVTPYGYPPLLFLVLGALLLITGSPLTTGHVIVPILVVGLGLSTYALSRAMIRSVILSLALLSILLLDPYFMTLFFWGALPNLLAFVFTNLALLGFVWVGVGKVRRGLVFFWVFATATVMSHSLGGLGLGATVAVALLLSLFVPYVAGRTVGQGKSRDAPALLLRRLVFSYPGYLGAAGFLVVVGGWYLSLHLLGIVGPGYFTPGTAVQPATFGQFLRNLLPGLRLGKLAVFYLLVGIVVGSFVVYGGLLSLRPQWVSTPLVVLAGAWIAIPGLAIVGWLLSVSTDYHRFGFLLVIPAGLSIAFLVDRVWLAQSPLLPRAPVTESAPGPPSAPAAEAPFPRTVRPTHRGRVAFVGVFAVVIVFLAAVNAAPIYVKYVTQNAGPTHDQLFLDALDSIDHSGLPGSILTVKGNLKWTWAIAQRNAYAPRPGNAFLFYPVQKTDSALAYYALTARDAMTNGLMSVSLRASNVASYVDGIPDLAVYQGGGLSQTLSIDPALVQVTLVGASNGTAYEEGLSGAPSYQPASALGQPAVITYNETGFVFQQFIVMSAISPTVQVSTAVRATGPDRLLNVQEVVVPPAELHANAQATGVPGTFEWQAYGIVYTGLVTVGTVTPTTALTAVPGYYPPSGGSAAILDYTPPGSVASGYINGSIAFTTPKATSSIPNLPVSVSAPQIWKQLDVQFILLPNLQAFSLYAGAFLVDESEYLVGEFGCQPYYGNSEWLVLTVPAT